MNAKAQAVEGMSYNVPLTMGNWNGKVDMLMIRLDDFNLILGIYFMRKNQIIPMPHLDRAMVMQESNPYFIPCVHPFRKEGKKKAAEVSSVVVEKGLK